MTSRAARAEHYRNKAEECRIIAETMKSSEVKEFMMGVSADYQMLARVTQSMDDPVPASEDFDLSGH